MKTLVVVFILLIPSVSIGNTATDAEMKRRGLVIKKAIPYITPTKQYSIIDNKTGEQKFILKENWKDYKHKGYKFETADEYIARVKKQDRIKKDRIFVSMLMIIGIIILLIIVRKPISIAKTILKGLSE